MSPNFKKTWDIENQYMYYQCPTFFAKGGALKNSTPNVPHFIKLSFTAIKVVNRHNQGTGYNEKVPWFSSGPWGMSSPRTDRSPGSLGKPRDLGPRLVTVFVSSGCFLIFCCCHPNSQNLSKHPLDVLPSTLLSSSDPLSAPLPVS